MDKTVVLIVSVVKVVKNWPSSCSALGECLYNVEVQLFSYVSFFSLQQSLSYIDFYGKKFTSD